MPRATVPAMSEISDRVNRDISDAIARGFGYQGWSEELDEYEDDGWDDEPVRAPLALTPAQQTSFAEAIRAGVRDGGCDSTLRAAQAWAHREGVPWTGLRTALEDRGGFCDCEVLMNVLEPPD